MLDLLAITAADVWDYVRNGTPLPRSACHPHECQGCGVHHAYLGGILDCSACVSAIRRYSEGRHGGTGSLDVVGVTQADE